MTELLAGLAFAVALTELCAVTVPDVSPLANALLAVAPLMGELLAGIALAVALVAMGAKQNCRSVGPLAMAQRETALPTSVLIRTQTQEASMGRV
jgi:hypothetical protein